MIFCLEGASAIGKSTLAKELSRSYGFDVVPEANELFKRNANDYPNWYLDRQVERWDGS